MYIRIRLYLLYRNVIRLIINSDPKDNKVEGNMWTSLPSLPTTASACMLQKKVYRAYKAPATVNSTVR